MDFMGMIISILTATWNIHYYQPRFAQTMVVWIFHSDTKIVKIINIDGFKDR